MRTKSKIDISSICRKKDIKIIVNYNKLFDLIDELNISQCDFCDLSKISRQTLESLRKRNNVNWSTIAKILNGLYKIDNRKHTIDEILTIEYK